MPSAVWSGLCHSFCSELQPKLKIHEVCVGVFFCLQGPPGSGGLKGESGDPGPQVSEE